MKDLVIGIDASTTAVKAIAFDRAGREVFQARHSYPLFNPAPGHFEQDAEDWWVALTRALTDVTREVGAGRIAALSIAHQRETFVPVDKAGKPLAPGILWLDERARKQVAQLSAGLGRDAIRDWSGKPPDPTPALYPLAWLLEHRPNVLRNAHALLDVHGFLVHRLSGKLVTSTASADPLGIMDLGRNTWHPRLVEAAGLTVEQLPELAAPGAIIGEVSETAAKATGLTAGLPIVAGAGDGQAMGVGMAVVEEGSAYLSLGSGVVSGAFSGDYITSDAFRTMSGPTGGYMLETVLRSGMQLVEWVLRTTGAKSPAELEGEARAIAPGSENLVVMPYFSGVMSPYWDETARGAMVGLGLHHRPAHLFRAAFEGIAFEQAVATEALETATGWRAETMVAAGGGIKSQLLMSIIASVLDRPLRASPVDEAAALGAAMLAAAAIGWYPDRKAAAFAMVQPTTRVVEPDPELVTAYRPRLAIYRDLFGATRDIHRRLAELG